MGCIHKIKSPDIELKASYYEKTTSLEYGGALENLIKKYLMFIV